MTLCSNKHDEICYEVRDCPLCAAIDSRDEEVRDLKSQLSEVEKERDDFQAEFDSEHGIA